MGLHIYLEPHISKQTPHEPMGRRNRAEVMQIRSWRLFSGFLLYGMSVSLERCVFMPEGK